MAWLLNHWQVASYQLGYARGLRGKRRLKCPWWTDHVVYSSAYIEGMGARPKD